MVASERLLLSSIKAPGAAMNRGYFFIARKMFLSWLMEKPSLFFKLWLWMLNEANFKDRGSLKRGQFITSVNGMREAMSHMVGYRKVTPTVGQIRSAYEAFTRRKMISITKTTRGMVVTILNYDHYQSPTNYELHSEARGETQPRSAATTHDTERKERKRIQEKADTPVSSCADPQDGAAPNILITLPLKDGSEFAVTDEFAKEMDELYPGIDTMLAFRNMKGWLIGNPSKKKTKTGIKRFITNWLSRELHAPNKGRMAGSNLPRHTQNNLAVISELMEEE